MNSNSIKLMSGQNRIATRKSQHKIQPEYCGWKKSETITRRQYLQDKSCLILRFYFSAGIGSASQKWIWVSREEIHIWQSRWHQPRLWCYPMEVNRRENWRPWHRGWVQLTSQQLHLNRQQLHGSFSRLAGDLVPPATHLATSISLCKTQTQCMLTGFIGHIYCNEQCFT